MSNSLVSAVKLEAENLKSVGSLYAQSAIEIAALVETDPNGAHVYLSEAQDATLDPGCWNRVVAGTKKALGALPKPLVMTATRDFRPTFRLNKPLFVVELKSSVEDRRRQESAKQAEQADKIAKDAAADNAAKIAAAETERKASLTPKGVAADILASLMADGVDPAAVLAELIAEVGGFMPIPAMPLNGKRSKAAASAIGAEATH